MMNIRLVAFLLLLFVVPAVLPPLHGQYASISGIVNVYTPVTSAVTCNGTLDVENSVGFGAGDTVVIMQMKGATIDNSNSPAFGTILDYGGAGTYEFGVIASITGNTITLRNRLLNAYDPAGLVQLIRVPHYSNASIDGELTAPAWDGRVGGVLVIDVADTLRLNADIVASGLGFRGGSVSRSGVQVTASDYYYTMASGHGGRKGEGLAEYTAQYEAGRGAHANGGGGGNDHNAGGGGGGNGGAGGRGGRQYSAFGPEDIGGIGGNAIAYQGNGTRAFLGGGGGGGHQNEDRGTEGTRGGGLVIIRAHVMLGNARSIVANGVDQITEAGVDGAGGGGAGGTVLLQIDRFENDLNVKVNGGRGGDNNDNFSTDCVGTGGGGGGGLVWTSLPTLPGVVTTQLNGGLAGLIVNQSPCFNTTYGADTGRPGSILTGLVLPQSDLPPAVVPADAGNDRTICEGESTQLNASGGVSYSWSPAAGLSCTDCANPIASPASSTTYTVTVIDAGGCTGTDSVRITVQPCGGPGDLVFYFPLKCVGQVDTVLVGFYNLFYLDTAISITFSGAHAEEYTLYTTLPIELTPTKTIKIPVIHRGLAVGRQTTLMHIRTSSGLTHVIQLIATVDEAITPVLDRTEAHLGVHSGVFDTCITVRNTYYTRTIIDDYFWLPSDGPFELTGPSLPIYIGPGDSAKLCLRLNNASATSQGVLYLGGYVVDSCDIDRCISQSIHVDTRSGGPSSGFSTSGSLAAGAKMTCSPNPFTGIAGLSFTLVRSGDVRIELVDLLGRSVRLLADGPLPAGEHLVAIDGASLARGRYFVVLQHAGERSVLPVTIR